MATPHNSAEKGMIAKTVLMPGDPLRAKFIAETFLENSVQFNNVRGMMGFTGTYKGREISVMGSGMGMPSIGIYSYELFTQYDVENIIRIGSAGSYVKELKLYDVVFCDSAFSESSFARMVDGYEGDVTYPSEVLKEKLQASADELGIRLHHTCVHSSDVFYNLLGDEYLDSVREKGCGCVEMESFALFHYAKILGKHAACLLTISDSFVEEGETTAEERQTSFTKMMEIALNAKY